MKKRMVSLLFIFSCLYASCHPKTHSSLEKVQLDGKGEMHELDASSAPERPQERSKADETLRDNVKEEKSQENVVGLDAVEHEPSVFDEKIEEPAIPDAGTVGDKDTPDYPKPKCPSSSTKCPNLDTKFLFSIKVTNKKDDTYSIRGVIGDKDRIYVFLERLFHDHHVRYQKQLTLYAYDTNGKLLWNKDLVKGYTSGWVLTGQKGIVYVTVQAKNLERDVRTLVQHVDKDGKTVWYRYFQGEDFQKPALRNHRLYVAGKKLYCLELSSGKDVWTTSIVSTGFLARMTNLRDIGPVLGKNVLYVLNQWGVVFCLDFSGKTLWSEDSWKSQGASALVVSKDDFLYFFNGAKLRRISSKGKMSWFYPPSDAVYPTMPGPLEFTVDKDENVYFQSFSVDKQGGLRWKLPLALGRYVSSPFSSPFIFQKGLVYCTTRDLKKVVFINPSSGKEVGAYVGHPRVNIQSTDRWSNIACTRAFFGTENRLITYLISERNFLLGDVTYLFMGIKLDQGTFDGFWPTRYGNVRDTSEVQSSP